MAAHDAPGSRRDRPTGAPRSERWRRLNGHRRRQDLWLGRNSWNRPLMMDVCPIAYIRRPASVLNRPLLASVRYPRASLGHFGLCDQIRDEARLRECGDMDFGRPILGLEAAGLAVTVGDGLHRMPPQPLVIGGKAHRHVAADI